MNAAAELRGALQRGLRELELDVGEPTQDRLLAYVELLERWNRRFNLTAVRDPRQMIIRHLIDSLSILPLLKGSRFIDVGTGAGLPGVPLAIALPEKRFTLLDSNGKKTRFLVQVRATLGLDNVEVVHARVRDYHPPELFDAVLTRAFASLDDMIAACGHLIGSGGELLAMKGQRPEDEIAAIAGRVSHCEIVELSVPGLTEARCLVRIRP